MRKTLLAATALGSTVMFLVPGALAFDWNGPYIGGLTGVVKSTGSIDWSFSSDFLGTTTGAFDFDGLGLLAGVTAGINYKLDDKFVVGVEGDASLVWLTSKGTDEDFYYSEFEEELNSLLTLRGRFGVLTNDQKTLFYVTGGLAGGNVKASAYLEDFLVDDPPTPALMSGFVVGVIGGVGIEHVIKDDLTAKAEVLAYRLGSLSGTGYAGKGESTATYNPSGIIFRTGINFHF